MKIRRFLMILVDFDGFWWIFIQIRTRLHCSPIIYDLDHKKMNFNPKSERCQKMNAQLPGSSENGLFEFWVIVGVFLIFLCYLEIITVGLVARALVGSGGPDLGSGSGPAGIWAEGPAKKIKSIVLRAQKELSEETVIWR